jgi:hypothetical protein
MDRMMVCRAIDAHTWLWEVVRLSRAQEWINGCSEMYFPSRRIKDRDCRSARANLMRRFPTSWSLALRKPGNGVGGSKRRSSPAAILDVQESEAAGMRGASRFDTALENNSRGIKSKWKKATIFSSSDASRL